MRRLKNRKLNRSCNCKKSTFISSANCMQKAIANVIHAEGEKIKKVTSSSSNIDDIIRTNCSVSKNIRNITLLEYAVEDNFKLYKSFEDECEEKDNTCKCNIDGGTF